LIWPAGACWMKARAMAIFSLPLKLMPFVVACSFLHRELIDMASSTDVTHTHDTLTKLKVPYAHLCLDWKR
jgi:hypothetical protein